MAEPDPRASNAPEITVSELSNALKRAIEDRFGYVRVRGEISGYRGPHSSGHAYFSLKDAGARLDAVIWRTAFSRMRVKPEEGLEVVATGKLTTFPGKSSYQIVIESLELAGLGALMALFEARRKKLAEEGLFDAARKRKIPFMPKVVGVVTSPTGAVIRDILHRLSDRFPVRVVVWPVRVQGETSAAEVAAAIEGFNALEPGGLIPRPDVLIVARGGGSLEDLWSFNEEIAVRAAALSAIPLIAAVGHETDWTLIDHAADLRAPTPTAAAEFAVPVRAELIATLADLDARKRGAILRLAERRRADLRSLARALPGGEALVEPLRQRLDRAGDTLAARTRAGLDSLALRLAGLARGLARHSPRAHFAGLRERVRGLVGRLERLAPDPDRAAAPRRRRGGQGPRAGGRDAGETAARAGGDAEPARGAPRPRLCRAPAQMPGAARRGDEPARRGQLSRRAGARLRAGQGRGRPAAPARSGSRRGAAAPDRIRRRDGRGGRGGADAAGRAARRRADPGAEGQAAAGEGRRRAGVALLEGGVDGIAVRRRWRYAILDG